MGNRLEELIGELFQHIEFVDGGWMIETEDSYVPATDDISSILDELEAELQTGAYVEEDTT